jgi:acetate---CoA ligase (ADP-forming)
MPTPWVVGDLMTTVVDPSTTDQLLRAAGLPVVKQAVVRSVAAAEREAGRLGYPVALKATSPGLLHKDAVGGVRLNLRSAADVRRAASEMHEQIAGLDGYVVQPMIPDGLEMVVGLRRDPVFGAVVMAGLGGTLVEVIGDVAIRLVPVSEMEAVSMISELRVSSTASLRQHFGNEYEYLARVVTCVSELARHHSDIFELDLNPVIVSPNGAVVVDAKLVRVTGPIPPPGTWKPAEGTISKMLNPESIVVVGASANPAKQGGRLFRYLVKHRFPGRLYAVNPHTAEILGRPCYPSVDELPESPDMACIVVPADDVEAVVEACGKRGIPAAIVFTSGFAETGAEGIGRQAHLLATSRRYGIRLCGPNTAGMMNSNSRMCAAFGMAFEVETIPEGKVAMISQSGAIGSALLSRAWDQGVGVGSWICTGNEADLTLGDYMLALVDDPSCSVLALFMETVRDPETFKLACTRARERGKRVVVYKSGKSAAGSRATQTHTGAIAGDDAVYNAVFRAYGVVRVPDLQALIDAAGALSELPLPTGRGIGVVSASGGACSVVADECAKRDLRIAELSADTVRAIATVIPQFGVPTNPIDVTMEVTVRPAMLGQVAELVLQDPAVDALLVMLTTNADPPAVQVAKGVIAAAKSANKPVVVARIGAEFLAPTSLAMYRKAGIPVFAMPERAVLVLRALVDAAEVAAPGDEVRAEVRL